ncbi:MAG TPA: glycosyltransferase family 2 protein [Polyangia bacterium]|nr:glycosyltransferase family 2 protein [Polyangia bacterium]
MTVPLSLSVVITNYNTAALTRRCLQGIHDHFASPPAEVIVVDDASKEKLRGLVPPETTVIENATNQGYVRSVNIGVARATSDLVLLLDSDATPLSDAMAAAIARFSSNPRLGALGFHLVDQAGARTGASQPEPRAWGLAVGQQLEARLLSYVERVSSPRFTIHSCALAFRRATFLEVGGFDEGFDFLDADTDFSMRLWRAGWELEMEEDARIFHEGSGSPQTTTRRVIRFHVNRWRLLEKHGLISHPGLLKGALAARHLAELVWLKGRARFHSGDRGTWLDKASGRRQLLSTVWRSYRSP